MNRLKELRKQKGLTQQGLADEISVSKITVLRWENEERQIKPEKAQQLADFFGVSVGYLLGYDVKLSGLQEQLLSSSQELVKSTKEVYSLLSSNLEIEIEGVIDLIDLLIKAIESEKIAKKEMVEALNHIKEFALSIDDTVSQLTEYQAKYTAEQLLRYKLEKNLKK